MLDIETLVAAFAASQPKLDIWRRYPDVAEAEDDYTDHFACEEVSALFATFARQHGWDAVVILAEGAEEPFADYHAWVRLTRGAEAHDVDWTARQYHNLRENDEAVLFRPWPLVWVPTGGHPIAGTFRKMTQKRGTPPE